MKIKQQGQGIGGNATPDFQQLIVQARVILMVDSSTEDGPEPDLEQRVEESLANPQSVDRFGAWSLGESTHLIDDVKKIDSLPSGTRVFLDDELGDVSFPVWVDHVGSKGTVYAVGRIEVRSGELPPPSVLPTIRSLEVG